MSEYKVVWEIELEAGSPEEAAQEAFKIFNDPDNTAVSFVVISQDGVSTIVDLVEEDKDVL